MTFDHEEVVMYPASAIQMPSKNPLFGGSRNTDLYKLYIITSQSALSATSGSSLRQEVVVKTWRTRSEISQGENRRLFKMILNTELEKWQRASFHPNIASLLGQTPDIRVLFYDDEVSEHESIPGIILPYFQIGNAIEYLIQNIAVDAIPILIGTADAIRFLHTLKPPIIHTKIKGCNIMISNHRKPILTDIGMGNIHHPPSGQNLSDVRWMPPEFIDSLPAIQSFPSSTASDVYSFAMTILELLTRSRPYSNRRFSAQVVLDVHTGMIPSRPQNCEDMTDAVWDVLTKCWNRDPEQRPDVSIVSGILETGYFLKGGREFLVNNVSSQSLT